jgi:signal peptidase II
MRRDGVPLSRWVLFWGIALGGAAFDLATKHLVFSTMSVGQIRPVVDGILELHLSHNSGALWGFGAWLPHSGLVFAVLSIVAGVAILYWLFIRGAARDAWLTAALGLIMAGAMGNCYDRLRYGYVRDFVHFHVDSIRFDCAIFNFADNMLVLGAMGLVILALRPERPEPSADDAGSAPTSLINEYEDIASGAGAGAGAAGDPRAVG